MRFTVEAICQAHGISRQAYYQHRRRHSKRQERAEAALDLARAVRKRHPRMGTRKLYHLRRERFGKLGFGRDKLFALLREQGLLIEQKRSRRSTTNSRHGFPTYQNLTTNHPAKRPNQVWVADLTYLETKEGFRYGFRYASLVMDAQSRKIVGFKLSDSLLLGGQPRGAPGGACRHCCRRGQRADPSFRPGRAVLLQALHGSL